MKCSSWTQLLPAWLLPSESTVSSVVRRWEQHTSNTAIRLILWLVACDSPGLHSGSGWMFSTWLFMAVAVESLQMCFCGSSTTSSTIPQVSSSSSLADGTHSIEVHTTSTVEIVCSLQMSLLGSCRRSLFSCALMGAAAALPSNTSRSLMLWLVACDSARL